MNYSENFKTVMGIIGEFATSQHSSKQTEDKIINITKFSSKQAYQVIKGHYIPIIRGTITDESVLDLEKRKVYLQKYEIFLHVCSSTQHRNQNLGKCFYKKSRVKNPQSLIFIKNDSIHMYNVMTCY